MACSDGESECPLCMESLEIDDIDFYPCKCEYQICRFCWHRIRTDENGLCPACRQPYPENPVNFKPISSADVRKHKDRKKQKQQAEKVKESESRQHLANYRVLQKNLMYVVGLSNKLLDLELLKKPEYFGRYGKILKMVTGTAPGPHVGAPPAQSVYVTYGKVEEALRAIQGVNNCYIDGRPVKASLGTTKYCSSFLQSKKCLKPDCMYLHEVAEPEISFTRDDMHAGKHADYEKRLSDLLLSKPPMTYNYLSQKVGPSKSYVTPAKDESAWPSMDEANRFGEEQENKQPVVASNEAEVMSQLAFNDSCSNDGSTVEDPAPSDVGNSKISQELKKVKQSVTRRRPERDTVMDQSHSPPSDPEGSTDRQVEDSLHRVNEILSEISKDEVSEEAPTPAAVRVEIPIYPQEEESSFGNLAPAPESGGDAPAPLTDWQSLLGFSMPQTSQNGLSLFAGPSTTTISAPTPTVPAPIKRPTPSAAPQTTAPFGLPPSSSSTLLSHAPSSVSPVASCRNPPPGLSKCTSDDDLGFDPFSESAKGLAQLLEEEEESPQPQSSHYSQSLSGLGNSLSQLSLFGQQHQMQTQNSLFQQMSAYGQPPSQQQQQQQSDLSGLHSLWNKPTQAPTAPSSTSSYLQAYQEQQRQLYLQQHRQQQQLLLQHLQQQQQQQHQQIGDNSLLRMLSQTTSSTVDPLQQLLQQQQQQQQQQSRMNQSEAMLQELARQRSSQLLRQQQQQQQQQQQYQNGSKPLLFQRQSSAPQPQSSHPQGSLLHMLHSQQMQQQQQQQQQQQSHMQEKAPFGAPPGLASLQRQQSASAASTTSQMMPPGLSRAPGRPSPPSQQQTMTEWQEGFKALLPNVNVRFMNSSSSAEASSNAYEPTSIPRSAVPPPPGFR